MVILNTTYIALCITVLVLLIYAEVLNTCVAAQCLYLKERQNFAALPKYMNCA